MENINRIKHLLQAPIPGALPVDYYELWTEARIFVVSRSVARAIERKLTEDPKPQWILFRSVFGARHRVRVDKIRHLSENTREQRRLAREFSRQRALEEKEDRLPGDDELDL